jgi:hypothetical protein
VEEVRGAGGTVTPIVADTADPEAVDNLFERSQATTRSATALPARKHSRSNWMARRPA